MRLSIFIVALIYGSVGVSILILNASIDHNYLGVIMSYLSQIGSFLSGVGTVIAAIAAFYGVNSWIKQLRYGKYLTILWDAKVVIRKIYSLQMDWYIRKYQVFC
ncbi:MAG: hypothetical protein MI974_13880 [Chitinophagales bacterium]|nr:hypothetical protein [Chitinophagales bacterium]